MRPAAASLVPVYERRAHSEHTGLPPVSSRPFSFRCCYRCRSPCCLTECQGLTLAMTTASDWRGLTRTRKRCLQAVLQPRLRCHWADA